MRTSCNTIKSDRDAVDYDEENPDTAHETTAKRNIAQGLLLIDISRLIDGLTRLQGQLRRARVRKWLVHGTMYVSEIQP